MTFNNPAAFFGAFLAIPIIVFYMLRLRMRRVPVATVMFWEQVVEEKQPRSLWRKLRHLVSLLIQLLLLAVLIVALADPVSNADAGNQQRLVVVVDTTASMQAVSGTGSRLDKAIEHMLGLVEAMKPGDQMAIVTAGARPRVVCGLTSHRRALREHVAGIVATDAAGSIPEAVSLAQQIPSEDGKAQILVFSDACFPEVQDLQQDFRIQLIQVGDTASNVAVTNFQVRRSRVDLSGYQTLIEVRNFSDRAAECSMELKLDERLEDVIPIQLKPDETWSRILDNTTTESGVLSVQLSVDSPQANALSLDDRASAILSERRPIPVTLVSKGNWFLQKALEAHESVDLSLAADVPAELRENEILVLHGFEGGVLPPGPVIVVFPQSSTNLWNVEGLADDPLAGWQDPESPVLRHVQWKNILIPQAVRLTPTAEHRRLVETASGDPLLLQFSRDDGDAFVLTPDLEQGDLPLRTAFPILLGNMLNWFSGQARDIELAIPAGTQKILTVPANILSDAAVTGKVRLISPNGTSELRPLRNATAPIGPLEQTGIWTLTASETDSTAPVATQSRMQIACNATNPAESELRPVAGTVSSSATDPAGTGHRPRWMYLAMVALALLLVEWCLFQRRWIA